jgi:ribosome-binding factor A
MSQRPEKANKLIKHLVSEIISRELSIKEGVFITIVKVDTSSDLRYAKTFVSIFPDQEADYALKTLNREIFKIQGILNKKLRTRPLPRISFYLDTTESEADKIEKLLKEI